MVVGEKRMLLWSFFFFLTPWCLLQCCTQMACRDKRQERDVKRSCPPVFFSCTFIFIQATSRLGSIYFGLFMPSHPAEPWPFPAQTQQDTPLTALSFYFAFLPQLVRHLLRFFPPSVFLLFWDTTFSMCQLEDVGGGREGARSVWELHIDSYWHLPPCRNCAAFAGREPRAEAC